MTVIFYTNNSENEKVDKSLSRVIDQSGNCNLDEGSDILNPTLLFNSSGWTSAAISRINYVFIQEFNRYYYVDNITIVRQNMLKLKCHVDVLMTYKSQIRSNYAVISRQKNNYNLQLNDSQFKVEQKPRYQYLNLPNGFSGESFVLAVAGAN